MFGAMKFVDIPEVFRSTETGRIFEHCTDCNRNLIEGDLDYVIEKAIRRFPEYHATDTIFEYAICLQCHQKIRKSFSEESIQKVEGFFTEHVDIFKRMRTLVESHSLDVNDWLARCMVKDTPIGELKEYQIFGHFKGDKLVLSYLPGMLSIESLEELSELLSEKTKDELNGYMERFTGLPPEFKELFTPRPAFVI